MKNRFYIGLILSVLLVMPMTLTAQSKISNRTALVLLDRQSREQSPLLRSVTADNKVSAFIHFNGAIDVSLLEQYGVEVNSQFEQLGIVTAVISLDNIEALAAEEAIKYIEVGNEVNGTLELARSVAHVNEVHGGNAPLSRGYHGKGIILGVVDQGFQLDHPTFIDSNGKSRIQRAWLQNKYVGTKPANYNYGVELSTSADILDAQYTDKTDDTGHGCHVLGIAAGSDKRKSNPYYGIADQSDIVLVSYSNILPSDVSIVDAVKYIMDYAQEQQRPVVVNLSLGSHSGAHDGTSTFDKLVDQLVGPGRIIIGASGNEGANKIHASKSFTEDDTEFKGFVKFNNASVQFCTLQFWGEEDQTYEVKAVVYDKITKAIVAETEFFDASTSGSKKENLTFSNGDDLVVDVSCSFASGISMANNRPNINIDYRVTNLDRYMYIGYIVRATSGTVNIWTDATFSTLSNQGVPGWASGDTKSTVGEVGGTAHRIITVGSLVTSPKSFNYKVGSIAGYSSKGPTLDGRVKPDVVAPGCHVISAVPNTNYVLKGDYFDKAREVTIDGTTYYYSYMSGTSMATPVVTGIVALWLEANPNLTPEDLIDVLYKTSIRDEFTTDVCPNNTSGYGKINAYAGLLYVLGLTDKVQDEQIPTILSLYPNPASDFVNIGFTRADNDVKVLVYSVDGRQMLCQSVGSVTAGYEAHINVGSLVKGTYIVKIQGVNTSETQRLIITK